MDAANTRAELLATARSLRSRDPGRFSVAALCRETGLSRSRVRRHFPTKSALMSALLDAAPAPIPERRKRPRSAPAGQKDWVERRLRVCERALSILEAKAEDTAREQSRSISMLEERLPHLAAASLASMEVPPFAEAPLPAKADIEAAAGTIPPPELLAVARENTEKPRRAFPAREKLQNILESARLSESATSRAKFFSWKPTGPGLAAIAAVTVAVLVIGAVVSPFDNLARAKQTPSAATGPGIVKDHEVFIIDATGAAPDPNTQPVSPAIRDVALRAQRGEAQAQTELAMSFLRGQNVAADPIAAARWSNEAAAQGEPTAQFILGTLYAEGIKPDPHLAFEWFSAAASHGNVKAMHNLAIAYMNGVGVTKDAATAVSWFSKAAHAGYRDSAFDLAVLYERGEGVSQSPQEALTWYDAAASLGDTEAAERAKILRSQLSQVAQR